MKKTKYIIAASITLLAMTGLTSCLKETPGNTTPRGSGIIVAFAGTGLPVSSTSIYPQFDNGLVLAPDTAGFNVNIQALGGSVDADLPVTLAVNASALADFNTNQSTSYVIPPSDVFSFPATATIPKGTRDITVRVVIKGTSSYDFTKKYALPLTISTSASGVVVSQNLGTSIYSFIVRNKYDGDYAATGYVFHPSSPRSFNTTYAVGTISPNQCKFPFGDLYSSNYYFGGTVPAASGAVTGYTPLGAIPTGAKSGFMTADNPGGIGYPTAPVQPGTAPWKSDVYNNSYDVSAKTFWFHVGYDATAAIGQNGWTRQLYMKLVKK